MSYKHGMAALNLEMPDVIPRTEYSAEFHWDLVNKVTGTQVSDKSDPAARRAATNAFMSAWDYGILWNMLTLGDIFGDKRTDMGHASYTTGGADYSDKISTLFEDPEDVYSYDMYEEYGTRDIKALTAEYDSNYDFEVARGVDAVPMTGIYVTLMSGLIELLGWETLLSAAVIDKDAFGAFVNRYSDWIMQYFEALAKCKSPVVMIHALYTFKRT